VWRQRVGIERTCFPQGQQILTTFLFLLEFNLMYVLSTCCVLSSVLIANTADFPLVFDYKNLWLSHLPQLLTNSMGFVLLFFFFFLIWVLIVPLLSLKSEFLSYLSLSPWVPGEFSEMAILHFLNHTCSFFQQADARVLWEDDLGQGRVCHLFS
jgi:hypothetical protein